MEISLIIAVTRTTIAKRTYYVELERRLAEGIWGLISNKSTYLYVHNDKDRAETFF